MDKTNFTMMDNQILHGLCSLPGNQIKVLVYLLRHSVGFHRAGILTTYSNISEWCGIPKSGAVKALKALESQGLAAVSSGRTGMYIVPDTLQMKFLSAVFGKEAEEDGAAVDNPVDNTVDNPVENFGDGVKIAPQRCDNHTEGGAKIAPNK